MDLSSVVSAHNALLLTISGMQSLLGPVRRISEGPDQGLKIWTAVQTGGGLFMQDESVASLTSCLLSSNKAMKV